MSYDVANRMLSATHTLNGTEQYGYDPANRQVWFRSTDATEYLKFYGPSGELLGKYWIDTSYSVLLRHSEHRMYFAGRLFMTQGNDWKPAPATPDRLGSVGRHYPYGERRDTGGMFAAYNRQGATNLDYAMNRWYSSQTARFTTPDPYQASAAPANPQSWNRYSYVEGDPVNYSDRSGLYRDPCLDSDAVDSSFCQHKRGGGFDLVPSMVLVPRADGEGLGHLLILTVVPVTRQGGGGSSDSSRDAKFRRDLQAAKANWAKVSKSIRDAVAADSKFTPQMMDCMAGLESAWNPKSDGPGERTGLYQYDRTGWEGDTTTPYSVANVQDVALSVGAALSGLSWRYNASLKQQPQRTAEQHLSRAFSLFNGESQYGEYGYGDAVVNCANSIDSDFDAGFKSIWNLLNP